MMNLEKPRLLSEFELNTVRGKALVGHATPAEILMVFGHLDLVEQYLDDEDENDFYCEPWRDRFGIPE